jgi:hypothetical protein
VLDFHIKNRILDVTVFYDAVEVKVNETHYMILFKVEELHITKIIILVSRIKDVKIGITTADILEEDSINMESIDLKYLGAKDKYTLKMQ